MRAPNYDGKALAQIFDAIDVLDEPQINGDVTIATCPRCRQQLFAHVVELPVHGLQSTLPYKQPVEHEQPDGNPCGAPGTP